MQRHHFANKHPWSQSYGFSSSHVWMWELDLNEDWSLKKWYFRIVVLEKTLEIPWTERSNQSILKKINPKFSLEEVFNLYWNRRFNTFGHLLKRASSLEKSMMLGKTEWKSGKGQPRMEWLDNTMDRMDMNVSKLQGMTEDGGAWGAAVPGVEESHARLTDLRTTAFLVCRDVAQIPSVTVECSCH